MYDFEILLREFRRTEDNKIFFILFCYGYGNKIKDS